MTPLFQFIRIQSSHRWKWFFRAPVLKQRLVIRIARIILYLYLAVNILALVFFAEMFFRDQYSQIDINTFVNRHLLVALVGLAAIRMLSRKLPAIKMMHYLSLPISKSTLAAAYLLRFLFSLYTFIPLLVLLPRWVESIYSTHSVRMSLMWLSAFIAVLGISQLIALWGAYYFNEHPAKILIIFGCIGLLILITDSVLKIAAEVSSWIFDGALRAEMLPAFIPLCGFGVLLFISYFGLRGRLYLE